jgi:hypothetical protein
MFKRKTLFVVGAGASHEVGLPVGSGLTKDIATRLQLVFDRDSITSAGDRDFTLPFFRMHQRESLEYALAYRTVREGIVLSRSIDDFLNIHGDDPRIVLVGKSIIARAIHAAEFKSDMYVDPSNVHNQIDFNKIEQSWFVKFMRVLAPGITVSNVENIFQNVAFIVFNYDRCIEHFLTGALSRLYDIELSKASEIVKTVTIIHPYGSIGSIERVPFGIAEHNPTNYVSLASEIKTYTEQIEDKTALDQMQNCVESAECIVFLGFAYHEQNMDLLRPDKPARKEIYGTAFGMSEADKLAVIDELNGSFPSHSGDRVHIRINNTLTCAGLFDFFAKSLAG